MHTLCAVIRPDHFNFASYVPALKAVYACTLHVNMSNLHCN